MWHIRHAFDTIRPQPTSQRAPSDKFALPSAACAAMELLSLPTELLGHILRELAWSYPTHDSQWRSCVRLLRCCQATLQLAPSVDKMHLGLQSAEFAAFMKEAEPFVLMNVPGFLAPSAWSARFSGLRTLKVSRIAEHALPRLALHMSCLPMLEELSIGSVVVHPRGADLFGAFENFTLDLLALLLRGQLRAPLKRVELPNKLFSLRRDIEQKLIESLPPTAALWRYMDSDGQIPTLPTLSLALKPGVDLTWVPSTGDNDSVLRKLAYAANPLEPSEFLPMYNLLVDAGADPNNTRLQVSEMERQTPWQIYEERHLRTQTDPAYSASFADTEYEDEWDEPAGHDFHAADLQFGVNHPPLQFGA